MNNNLMILTTHDKNQNQNLNLKIADDYFISKRK